MEQRTGTAACLIVKAWAGHRVGACVVLELDKAERFARLGVLEIIVQREVESTPAEQPMTGAGASKRRRRGHGS